MPEKKVNKLPAPTWNWLKMNDAVISVPEPLEKIAPISEGGILHFSARAGESVFFENEIRAGENEEKTIIMDYTSQDADENGGEKNVESAAGFFGIKTRVVLEKGARVHLVKIQMLDGDFTRHDQTFAEISDGAEFRFTQIELGGAKNFVEMVADLDGEKSYLKSDISYYCADGQELDINFVANQRGKKSQSLMNTFGTLGSGAKKTFRGTIDFKRGCAASSGSELEETLLLSENVVNKSIPLILCGEEDVSGDHGATIGSVSDEMLFYMNSRGIKKSAAEELMARAKVMRTAALIPNGSCVEKIEKFLDEIFSKKNAEANP